MLSSHHDRIFLPIDVLEKIGAHYHILDAINLATAFCIKLNIEDKGGKIRTTDYIGLISDSLHQYTKIVNAFSVKVGGEVLMYHIHHHNVRILQLFNEKCRVYYNLDHLREAIKCNDVIVTRMIVDKVICDPIHVKEMIKLSISYQAYFVLNFLIVYYQIDRVTVHLVMKNMLKHGDNVIDAYDRCDHPNNVNSEDSDHDHEYRKEVQSHKISLCDDIREISETFMSIEMIKLSYERKFYSINPPVTKIVESLLNEFINPKETQIDTLMWSVEYIKSQKSLDGQELHTKLHDIRKETGINPEDFFSANYLSFLGKRSGPKAGWFLSVLDRDFLIKRLDEVTK